MTLDPKALEKAQQAMCCPRGCEHTLTCYSKNEDDPERIISAYLSARAEQGFVEPAVDAERERCAVLDWSIGMRMYGRARDAHDSRAVGSHIAAVIRGTRAPPLSAAQPQETDNDAG